MAADKYYTLAEGNLFIQVEELRLLKLRQDVLSLATAPRF